MQHRSLAIFLALAAAGLLDVASAPGQEMGTLVGSVSNADTGAPVAAATVRLVELGREATSDENGRYRFDRVPAGHHTLEVEALGRVVASRPVEVAGSGLVVADLALAPRPIRAPAIRVVLDPARIVGSDLAAAAIPGSAHYLGPDDLERQPLLYDDVHKILRQVPGVVVQEEDGYGLRPNIGLRGTGSERSSKITLMEDGVLIAPAPYAAPAAYYFPVAGRMEAVEVRKGSSQIRYGPQTIGGAINLVSSSIPDDFSAAAELAGGADVTGKARLEVGDRYDHFGWLVETYQITTDGFKRVDGGGDTGFEIQDYVVKLAVHTRPDAKTFHELELKLAHYDETSNETYLGLAEADFRRDPFRRYAASQRDVMRADHDQVQLRWTVRPGARAEITAVAYDNGFHRNWYKLDGVNGTGIAAILDDPTSFPDEMAILEGATSQDDALSVRANNRAYESRGIQTAVGLELEGAGRHTLEAGARYHEDLEDRFQHDDGYRMEAGRMVVTSRGAPGSQSNRVSEANAWSLHLTDRIALGDWILTPGIRWETISFTRTDYAGSDPRRLEPTRIRENAVDALIPGIGALYTWTEGLHLFAGIHRGFGPPGPGADEETEPEESVNYEVGIKLRRPWLDAEVIGFYSDYENILGRATLAVGDPTGSGELFNGGAVEVKGLEVGLEVDPAAARGIDLSLPIRLAYTFTAAEFRSSFSSEFEPWGDVEAGDELPYTPEHQLHLDASLERGRWAARLGLQHVSAMRTVAGRGPVPEEEGTSAATIWSAGTEFAVSAWSTVFAGVENLTDEVYVAARRPAGARPGLPRTLLTGIRLRI